MKELNFREWVDKYLEVYAKRKVKPSTFESYKLYAQHIHIYKKLSTLCTEDLQEVINEMVDSGLRTSTVKHTATVMKLAVEKAEQLHYCDRALWYGIELPRNDSIKGTAFTEIEYNSIIADCYNANSIYADCILFILNTGLRIGELIALRRFTDVNIKHRSITVNNTVYRGDLSTPKTGASVRTIPLNDKAWYILMRQPIRSEFVFTNSDGNMINYSSILKSYQRILKRCGIPQSGLHKLRHTFATRLLSAGADIKSIQDLLGHASPDITMKYYLHPDQEQLRNVVNLL